MYGRVDLNDFMAHDTQISYEETQTRHIFPQIIRNWMKL